ncbi:MAG: hypothetical protein HC878_19620 [Leptolyngbyaceae cyanobacterium SL_5_14]|nr:hypothetical protein [Leptolyngbyaceae cyanobacterium SL_5_14]
MGLKKNVEQKSCYQAKYERKTCMIKVFVEKYKIYQGRQKKRTIEKVENTKNW